MGNKDKKFKKFRRKIRIRLADSNDPNSYICEVFDSSFENEEKDSVSPEQKGGSFKPKNYFELLMSKDCRKVNKVKTEVEENRRGEITVKIEGEKRTRKDEIQQQQRSPKPETDSSDDENLQVKKKYLLQKSNPKGIMVCQEMIEKLPPGISESEEELFTIFESPKIDSHKKKLGILNYFSKTNPGNVEAQANVKNPDEMKRSKIGRKENACKKGENLNRSEKKSCLKELNKENFKLAPLFYRKEKKIFDSAAQTARLNFLHNSLPVVKKVENKINDNDVSFPEVVHVQQKNNSPFWSVREIVLPLRKISTPESIKKTERTFRFDINGPGSTNDLVERLRINDKDFINKLKSKYANLNLNSTIDNLKKTRDEYLSLEEELEKSKSSKKDIGSDETGYEELNALWIEKYKPKSGDVLENGKTLKKLRGWLESWKSFDETLKALIKSKPKSRTESDDDAFLDSDDDEYGLKAPGNVCVISGPHASGKTALVFALASELEFKVLELNASSKRSGKKVLSDLQEATQSHKVHHQNVLKSGTPLRETKKRKKKKWKKGKKLEDAVVLSNNSDYKISLILIEDADVVFEEHDEGFISAITSLAQTSKRPLIFVANEPNCAYLESFKKDHCLILEMERPCFYKSCAILEVISSLEGAHTEEEFLKNLVRRNCFDLRKSLLELQFWTGSSPCLQRHFDLGQLWWGLGRFLCKNDVKHRVTSKGCKRKRQNDLFDPSDDEESVVKKPKLNSTSEEIFSVLNSDTLAGERRNSVIGSYFKILDLASVVDTFWGGSFSESIFGFEYKPKDGLSLEENLEEVTCRERNFGEELSEKLIYLSTGIFARDTTTRKSEERKFELSSPTWEEIRWQQSQIKASEDLSVLVPLQSAGDKRSLRLDYLPLIRNICRTEKTRPEMQVKRKNRFSHYLSNVVAKLEDCNLDANCKILNR